MMAGQSYRRHLRRVVTGELAWRGCDVGVAARGYGAAASGGSRAVATGNDRARLIAITEELQRCATPAQARVLLEGVPFGQDTKFIGRRLGITGLYDQSLNRMRGEILKVLFDG